MTQLRPECQSHMNWNGIIITSRLQLCEPSRSYAEERPSPLAKNQNIVNAAAVWPPERCIWTMTTRTECFAVGCAVSAIPE